MTESLASRDQRALLHPFTQMAEHMTRPPRIMVEAKGARIRDAGGREYIDAMAGLWCVNVGYGRSEIANAMAEQANRLAYYHAFLSHSNEPAIHLADRLLALAPEGMGRVFFSNSGSEANETFVKLIWYYNNLRGRERKKKWIARTGGYHGVTLGAASLGGLPMLHATFDLPLPGFLHVSKPHHYRVAEPGQDERAFSQSLAEELDALIEREGADTIAAFIAEPVMAAGGVIVPPEGYFEAIRPVLRHHDVLMVADEVVCGFGRLGAMFGSDVLKIEPDCMTLAKGLTSSYFPMSASLVSEEIFDVLRQESRGLPPFGHGHTTSAHPVGAAAALANLDIIESEALVARAERVGAHLQKRLRAAVADHPLVGEVRGMGLIAGVELVSDRAGRTPFDPERKIGGRLYELLLEEGLLSRALGDTLAFSPPLVIDENDADEIVARFAHGLVRLADEVGA